MLDEQPTIKRKHVTKQSMLENTKQEDNRGVLGEVRLERARNAATARLQEMQEASRKDAIASRVGESGRVLDIMDMLESSGYSLNNTSAGDASAASRQAQPAQDQEEEPSDTDDEDSEEYTSNPGIFF